jgi:transmembrane sensor
MVVFICLIPEIMDPLHTYDDIPWELIGSALQGTLSPDEDLLFREWLAVSADNQEKYARLGQLWKDGLTDYKAYREADEGRAWEAVRQRISGKRVIRPNFRTGRTTITRMAAAAVFLLAIGAAWWYRAAKNAPIPYETAREEQRKIALPDGSTVVIAPQTRMLVAADYNKGGRTVSLAAGQAHFEVSHQQQSPFRVEMDVVSVRDIGTAFTVQRTSEKIQVTVTSGKVAFTKKETGESRELAAGSSLIFYIPENRFGGEMTVDTASSPTGTRRYMNSPLTEVVAALELASGKKITLGDGVSGQQRLTVDIQGEAVDNDLAIICASLDLEYIANNGGFILKNRAAR